ncbi:MAG: DUF3179 domain-containing protein [Candidatus Bipolaricaulia bacterium]
MSERIQIVATVILISAAVATAALISARSQGQNFEALREVISVDDSAEINQLPNGTKYLIHPSNLLQGCPGRDCIPSIDRPKFVSIQQADRWIGDDELVIGVRLNGVVKAYPIKILNLHEIVNDDFAGEPVAVTYCPLCRSGLTFKRTVEDVVLEFGVSGKLFNSDLVMYDRQTESYWGQLLGRAIVGSLTGVKLDVVPTDIVPWENWKRAWPDSLVLSRETGIYPSFAYRGNPYGSYDTNSQVGFGVRFNDNQLHPKAIVYGALVDGVPKAYAEETIQRVKLINDEVGSVPILIVQDPETGGVRIFRRELDGEVLSFELREERLFDRSDREWRFTGESISGEANLEPINAPGHFWFAWTAFYPATELHQP